MGSVQRARRISRRLTTGRNGYRTATFALFVGFSIFHWIMFKYTGDGIGKGWVIFLWIISTGAVCSGMMSVADVAYPKRKQVVSEPSDRSQIRPSA
jgi:hypothetical protein